MDIATLQAHRGDGLPFRVSLEAVNKAVGVVALGLPFVLLAVTWLGNSCPGIDSISHYYYVRLGGDLMVGSLFLIGVLLTFFYKAPEPVDGYLGHSKWDIWAARFAGLCAFGVALSPTTGSGCEDYAGMSVRLFLSGASGIGGLDLDSARQALVSGDANQLAALAETIRDTNVGFDFWGTFGVTEGLPTYIHYGAALGMFLVLAYYALVVFPRPQSASALDDGAVKATKWRRDLAYRLCGVAILISIGALVYKFLSLPDGSDGLTGWNGRDLTFWFEALALFAFGVSWSIKGRLFAFLRDEGETDPKTAT